MILPKDWGELLCRLNLIIFKSFLTHYISVVYENAIMMNRKSTGATLYPCFTPTSKVMEMSIFPIISLTLLSVYIILIAEHNLGGQPYFFSISTISLWLEVSNALTRSKNITNVGRLWLYRRCNIFLIVKLLCWHPTSGMEKNCYFTPCFLIILNNLVHRILMNIFDPISISVSPLHLLGSPRSLILGTGTSWPSWHSVKSVSLFQPVRVE